MIKIDDGVPLLQAVLDIDIPLMLLVGMDCVCEGREKGIRVVILHISQIEVQVEVHIHGIRQRSHRGVFCRANAVHSGPEQDSGRAPGGQCILAQTSKCCRQILILNKSLDDKLVEEE
jgi:hypothetical protein